MDDNILGYDEWLQNYQETIAGQVAHPGGLSDDTNVVIATSASTNHNMLSPSNSGTSGGKLNMNPRVCIAKPIRRRSRVSKRTPITLLNANAANFRALVQQFTGCRGASTLSFGARAGPVNLNFAMANQQIGIGANNSMKAPFGYNYNHQQTQTQTQTQTQLQKQEEQPCMFSSQNISPSDGYASTCSNPTTPNIMTMEDLVLENISWNELIGDA